MSAIKYIVLALLASMPNGAAAQAPQWYDWPVVCEAFTSTNSDRRACLNFVVQAPGSFGATEWAGTPVSFWSAEAETSRILRYRVTHYLNNRSQCGQIREVRWTSITNRNVANFGSTAAYYLLHDC